MACPERIENITTINPATGEAIEHFTYHSPGEVEQALITAQQRFVHWRYAPIEQRVDILRTMAAVLRRNSSRYSATITREMGKLLPEAESEIEKCAFLCEWMAEHGPAFLTDEPAAIPGATAYISYRPLGLVLGVMPWNFPFWQVMRAAVPILLGGNGVVLKHAQNVTRCAIALEDAWREAGLPDGLFCHLRIPSCAVADILADRRIAAVTLTGSGAAGSAVAATAGKLLKKSVLELGGSDPFIVLADADIPRAVEAAIQSRYLNAGQVCIAAKRFILEAPIADAFTEQFVAKAQALTLAPIARDDLRDALHSQVATSIQQGARLLCGGQKAKGRGYFYEPTVLADVAPGMLAFEEEIFGPVAALTRAADAEEAIHLANRSAYGLSSNLWTADHANAEAIARRLETGAVFINGFSASDPRIPIGGIKQSGYGRELSHFGLREFTNIQTIVLRERG